MHAFLPDDKGKSHEGGRCYMNRTGLTPSEGHPQQLPLDFARHFRRMF